MVLKAQLVKRDNRVNKAPLVNKAQLEQLAFRAQLVEMDCEEKMVLRVTLVRKVILA
jgi:hypothetical protein